MNKINKHLSFTDKDFKKLQDRWYKKLKRSGFVDIELSKDSSGLLEPLQDKAPDPSGPGKNVTSIGQLYDSTELKILDITTNTTFTHYRLARIFLSHGSFSTKYQKFLFEQYAEGLSYSQIKAKLKARYPKRPRSVETIHRHLKELKKSMLEFHLNDKNGEYFGQNIVPKVLEPDFNPHTKTRRGKSRHKKSSEKG